MIPLPEGRFGLGLKRPPEHGQEEYTRLRQEIRASPVVYGDETGWRQDGRNGYLWSPEHSRGALRPGRSQRVVEEVLGDEFEGVLVSDFYGAYNVYQGPHQDAGPTCCVTSTNCNTLKTWSYPRGA